MPRAPRHNENAQTAVIGDHVVVLDADRGQAHLLNQSAAWVWDLIDGAMERWEIAEVIADAASLDRATIDGDVEGLLATFRERGLLEGDVDVAVSEQTLRARQVALAEPDPNVPTSLRPPESPAIGSYRSLGYSFVVRGHASALAEAVRSALVDLRIEDGDAPIDAPSFTLVEGAGDGAVGAFQVWSEEGCLKHASDDSSVVDHLLSEVNIRAISSAGGCLLFHAGAVAIGDHCVMLPAESGSGKSTLTAALVVAGHPYLTDEAVDVDPNTLVVSPYAKPLSLSIQSLAALSLAPHNLSSPSAPVKQQLTAGDLGGVVAAPTALGAVVFPKYTPGVSAKLEPLQPHEGFIELAPSTFEATWSVPKGLERVVALVCSVHMFRLCFDDLDEAVALIGSVL